MSLMEGHTGDLLVKLAPGMDGEKELLFIQPPLGQKKPYTKSTNPIFINPFLIQYKPKVLMKQWKRGISLGLFFFLFYSSFFSSFFFLFFHFLLLFLLKKKMKSSQSMVWIYGFFWPEGASLAQRSRVNQLSNGSPQTSSAQSHPA